jgi:hypothetical protein
MHIIGEDALQGSITQLSCPKDESGNITYPAKGDDLACTLAGTNLNQFAKLRLRSSADATDTTTAEGKVTVSGDSTKASVAFSAVALRALPKADYAVFSVTSNGVEAKTNQSVHLGLTPYVTGISVKELDFSKKNTEFLSLSVSGFHLATIKSLTIKTDKDASATFNSSSASTDVTTFFQVNASDVKSLTASDLSLTVSDGNTNYPITDKVKFMPPKP